MIANDLSSLHSVSMEDLTQLLTPPHSPAGEQQSIERISQYYNQRSYSDDSLLKRSAIDDRNTLVDEIRNKYFSDQVVDEQLLLFMPPISPCKYLAGKRSAGGNLELVVLNGRNIGRMGNLNCLIDMVQHVTELDLAQNSISEWRQVGLILSSIPNLRHCNLSQNPLNSEFPSNLILDPVQKLSSLVLNGTEIQWNSLFTLINSMPVLEELHLSLNNYVSVDDLTALAECPNYSTVHVLHLNNCNLSHWIALLRICRIFPCLETVVAACNHFTSIEDSSYMFTSDILGCLMSLNINKTSLIKWNSMDHLRSLPLLCELRVNQIPLLEPYSEEERRHLLIARLPEMTTLNGSQVTADNRLESERFFIRYFMEKEHRPKRYDELVAIHGQLDKLVQLDLRPKTTANVIILCEELNLNQERQISLNQTVGQFKKQLEQFCTICPARMRLFYIHKDLVNAYGPEELRLSKQMLHSLQIEDGDRFEIQKKLEPRTRRRTSSDCKTPTK